MNDLGLDTQIRNTLQRVASRNHQDASYEMNSTSLDQKNQPDITEGDAGVPDQTGRPTSHGPKRKDRTQNGEKLEDGNEAAYYQPALWWFTSTAFPLIAGTFGPIANLFSVCAIAQSWRVTEPNNARVGDPAWVLTLNIVSLVCALIANLLLLFNFAKRIPYRIAQPFTILSWYISCIFLVVPIGVMHGVILPRDPSHILSESYYYGFIAAILYFIISTLLLVNLSGAYVFHAYRPSFGSLTIPQRTLMLQTITFSCYLALGAGIFARIEGWQFVEGLYWADYTLLTIGLGSDFPPKRTAAKMLLLPYAAVGVTFVGLIVSSIRGLVLERAKARITKRRLEKERERWEVKMDGRVPRRGLRNFSKSNGGEDEKVLGYRVDGKDVDHHLWRRKEFELMRHVENQAKRFQEYLALTVSIFVFVVVWVGGSIVFWALERNPSGWTYPDSLYFAYVSILTIGYGDFFPTTNASRPFFVIWSLVAIPAVTVLISNMGDTVVRVIDEGTAWVGERSILPERKEDTQKRGDLRRRVRIGRKKGSEKGKARDTTSSRQSQGPDSTQERRQSMAQAEELKTEAELEKDKAEILEQGESDLTLTIRLTREIREVAKDAAQGPNHQYGWDEWVRWLRLMDEAGGTLEVATKASMDGAAGGGTRDEQVDGSEKSFVELCRWTWLGNQGPLFSEESETQWVLNRLCSLLEKVVQQEERQV